MAFQHPQLLCLLLLPLLLLIPHKAPTNAIPFPAAEALAGMPKSRLQLIAPLFPCFRAASIALAIVALARPQLVNSVTTVTSKGIDIALALDLSTSMLAVDSDADKMAEMPGAGGSEGATATRRTRLALARQVVSHFIGRRSGDRISVVAFGARAYPVAPLTLDHEWLKTSVAQLDTASVEDGTALGDGLLAAVERLRSSPAASRTAILVTDGRSNAGAVQPSAAAAAAAALGIRVHTIGIGGTGVAKLPVADPLGGVQWREVQADLDERALKEIATVTGGRYFRAETQSALASVFAEIDRLEKRKIEEKNRRSVKELFPYLLSASLLLILAEQALSSNRLRRMP